MERKQAKAERRASKRDKEGEEGTDEGLTALEAPIDPDARAAMFDGLF